MDIYRKELERIYSSQNLNSEELSTVEVEKIKEEVEIMSRIGRGAAVITDAALDRCFIFGGDFGKLMGIFEVKNEIREEDSSDEDVIYSLIHPEDLVYKRLLEYKFFSFVNTIERETKTAYKAVCRIRMKDSNETYKYVDNSTQLLRLSPAGKIWLILCCYNFSSNQEEAEDISPAIINMEDGNIKYLHFQEAKEKILSLREKEILILIKEGLPSKLIADRLRISVHTVNRHRQNIISKLSVGNSIEAVMAAKAMKLI